MGMAVTAMKDYTNAKKYPMKTTRFFDAIALYNMTVNNFLGLVPMHQYIPCNINAAGETKTTNNNMVQVAFNDGFGGGTDIYYQGWTPWVYPVIMTAEKVKISDLNYPTMFYHKIGYKETSTTKTEILDGGMTEVELKAAYGNKVVLKAMQLYDNSLDGNIAVGNPRSRIGWVVSSEGTPIADIVMRMYAYKAKTLVADYDVLTQLYRNFITSNFTVSPYGETFNTSTYRLSIQNTLSDYITRVMQYSTRQVAGADAPRNVRCLLMFDEDKLSQLLNEIGVPFTFNPLEATYKNTSDFTGEWIPTGQGTDDTGGGLGTGDNVSDPITQVDPDVTTISTFNKHYAVTPAMLASFGNYLWNSTFMDDIKLLFNDPMEGVVSCRMFPFPVPGGTGEFITIGNVVSTVTAYPISSSYSGRFDLGSINVEEYYGSALDYEPYTTLSIYLPYIGIKDISTNEFMGKTLNVKYIVDITTGAAIAQVWADTQLLYTFDGKMGVEIPVSSSNAAQFAAGLAMTGIAAIGGFAASGGNPLAVAGTVLATAKGVAGNQFHINKGGSNSPFAGFYMPQYPYLIINRPIQSLPSSFASTYGLPSNVTRKLSTLVGFTQVDEIQLTGIQKTGAYATQDELDEIERLLKQGVIL